MTDRNLKGLFFKVSGFTPNEIDELIYRQRGVKQAMKEQKELKRWEKRQMNCKKFGNVIRAGLKFQKLTQTKSQKISAQIQYGFDLAKWMGLQHG